MMPIGMANLTSVRATCFLRLLVLGGGESSDGEASSDGLEPDNSTSGRFGDDTSFWDSQLIVLACRCVAE